MPFDILVGNSWIREMIDNLKTLEEMEGRWDIERESFAAIQSGLLLYE